MAGYMPDADRFICGGFDVAGEEKVARERTYVNQQLRYEMRRDINAQREEDRWNSIDSKAKADQAKWDAFRESGLKARRNKSSVPFNPITLGYNDGKDGDRLRHQDAVVKYRAGMRAQNLLNRNNMCGFNPVTGAESTAFQLPPKPGSTLGMLG